jgi:hypothetical protein
VRFYPNIFVKGLKKAAETAVRIAVIRIRALRSTKQERCKPPGEGSMEVV